MYESCIGYDSVISDKVMIMLHVIIFFHILQSRGRAPHVQTKNAVSNNKPELPQNVLEMKTGSIISSMFAFIDRTATVSYCPEKCKLFHIIIIFSNSKIT